MHKCFEQNGTIKAGMKVKQGETENKIEKTVCGFCDEEISNEFMFFLLFDDIQSVKAFRIFRQAVQDYPNTEDKVQILINEYSDRSLDKLVDLLSEDLETLKAIKQ